MTSLSHLPARVLAPRLHKEPFGLTTPSDFKRVADRIRTGDRLDHNQELYQLSYSHRAASM